MKKHLFTMSIALLLILQSSHVFGDDVYAPDYRGSALTVEAHWDFINDPATSDNWNLVLPDEFGFVGGGGNEVLYNQFPTHIDFGNPNDWIWDSNAGAVTSVNPNGSVFAVNAQNWVDDLPLKNVRLQLTYTTGVSGLAPDVVAGTGVEMAGTAQEFDFQGFEVGSFNDGMNLYEDWRFEPNPDWEQLVVVVPFLGSVSQVDFDSISVPEPGMGLLLGSTMLFTAVRRRSA